MATSITQFVIYKKPILYFSFILVFSFNSYSQSNLSYKNLSPMLGLIENHLVGNNNAFYNREERLRGKVLELGWDFESYETFDTLYQQLKDENIDYRYPLIIAKAATPHYRNSVKGNKYLRIIDYYYKSLFLQLAIEKKTNRFNSHTDSLKYIYTQQYILTTTYDSCFPSSDDFRIFANLNIKYSIDLLKSFGLKLTKSEKSELYYIIGDATYRINDVEDSDKQKLSEVFKYLSLAIDEDPNNWRAVSERAYLKKTVLLDYGAAIKDYMLLLNIFEGENKKTITEHNKWLLKQKLNANENKMILGLRPAFENIWDIVECYINLNDNQKALVFLNKALVSIKEYREYNMNSDITSDYEGMIYFFKATTHFELKEKNTACEEIEMAINTGYDVDECKKLQIEMKCNPEIKISSVINSVPMTKTGGVYEIPVTINGVLKLNFIFDAGAADVSISSDVALTLIRTGTVREEDFIGTESYKFADGSIAKSKVFIIKEIQIGNKKIKNVRASISKSLNAPLLLGQSVLNRFGKVSIDYIKKVIIFEE